MNFYDIQTNKTLRGYAWQQLQGYWGKAAFTFFIIALIYFPYFFFSFMDGYTDEFSDDSLLITLIKGALGIGVWLVSGPFALGYASYFLKKVRGEEVSTRNIFDGFYRFGYAFVLAFISNIFIVLWTLLLIIPGIIKAYSYSMMFYILYDNPGMDVLDAITKSRRMMKGYKFKYFLLQLSFIGWFLLGILSLGIAYLWILPYYYLSMANFYENLKKNQEGRPVENQIEETPASDSAML